MEWREALEEAQSQADVDALDDQVASARRAMLERCQQLLDVERDYAKAAQQVRALMIVARFSGDIDRRREQLGQ